MFDQIDRIQNKLNEFKGNNWKKYDYNLMTKTHRFKLNPPAKLEDVELFELRYKINLPQDYRRFLLEIGNGGAGPYYGLLPLQKWYAAFSLDPSSPLLLDDFSHFSKQCTAHPDPIKGYGRYSDDYKLWEWNFDTLSFEWTYGTITLCSQGCENYCLLVVSGTDYGRICYEDEAGQPYFMPDINFLTWYERWLDETLLGKEVGSFGGFGWLNY